MSSRIGSTFGWLLVLACWSAGDGAAMSIGEAVTTSPSEGAATQELRVPANTAYHEQGPGADGQLAVWFGRLQQAGKLKVAVELELAEGEAYLLHFAVGAVETEGGQVNARSDDRVEHVHGTGASGQRVDFGEFDVAAAGYGRFELSVELEAGQAAPRPSALLLEGSAVVDAHFNLSGERTASWPRTSEFVFGICPVPTSFFLRPVLGYRNVLDRLRLCRIKKSMLHAAKENEIFHLWWHPHNFGINLDQNMSFLREIILYYQELRSDYGMCSLNMGEIAELALMQNNGESDCG